MKDAPVIDDEDVALPPMMGFGRSAGDPVLGERKGLAAALVHGFETAGIVSQEGSSRREDRRVEGTPAGTNEHWGVFEKVELFPRKAERLPIEEHRRRSRRSWVDTSEEKVTTGSGAMAEFCVER
ncbi:hypothetical protein Q3C01_23855 [Bradyrhizobium sp. UFLA05-109]